MIAIETIAGTYGTPSINVADGELTVDCVGFVSWDDATVISSIKTVVGATITEMGTTRLNLAGRTIPKGLLVTFGFTAQKITLSAGSGIVVKSKSWA